MQIDFNSDLGESFGPYSVGSDDEVLPYITSANIACGFHAGDAPAMRKTVARAKALGVAVGAHPGLPDLQGFGRREMRLSMDEAYEFVVYQIGALRGFTAAAGVALRHVKPHGALYNMAARDSELATAICQAIRDVDASLMLFGLANSELIRAGEAIGLNVVHEVFADRSYQADGTLTRRGSPGAIIDDPMTATSQILTMLREGRVRSQQGTWGLCARTASVFTVISLALRSLRKQFARYWRRRACSYRHLLHNDHDAAQAIKTTAAPLPIALRTPAGDGQDTLATAEIHQANKK